MFIIENGNGGYIANVNNAYTMTDNIEKAKNFTTYQKANNVIHSLPKTMRRHNFYVVPTENAAEPVTVKELFDDSEDIGHIKTILSELDGYARDVVADEEDLRTKQSAIDQELIDIDHYIEFYPLSASDGYKLSKFRQDKLRERRRIKDRLREIEILKEINAGRTKARLCNMMERKYTPRRLPELFKNGNIKFLS